MAAAYGEKRQIVIARPDGTTVKTFTSDSDDAQPVWQPMPTN